MKKRRYWWVWLIVIINIGIYLIESSNNTVRDSDYLLSIGAFKDVPINMNFGLYRIFSCQFIHTGFFHLLINMITFLFVTDELRKYQSSLNSFCTYCVGIIVVGLLLLLFNDNRITYLGNSGAICALISSWLVYGIKEKKKIRLLKNEIEIIVGTIITSIIIPGVSLLMHLSGMIGGAVFTVLLLYFKSRKVGLKK